MYPIKKLHAARRMLGTHIYLVEWEGCGMGTAMWELEEHIAKAVVIEFWSENPAGRSEVPTVAGASTEGRRGVQELQGKVTGRFGVKKTSVGP